MTALVIALTFAAGVIVAYHLGRESGLADAEAVGRRLLTSDERWQA